MRVSRRRERTCLQRRRSVSGDWGFLHPGLAENTWTCLLNIDMSSVRQRAPFTADDSDDEANARILDEIGASTVLWRSLGLLRLHHLQSRRMLLNLSGDRTRIPHSTH
jgi:hypothetical protein